MPVATRISRKCARGQLLTGGLVLGALVVFVYVVVKTTWPTDLVRAQASSPTTRPGATAQVFGPAITRRDSISPNSFPPVVILRFYRTDTTGLLGPGWWCGPLDASVSSVKLGDQTALGVVGPDGSPLLFVPVDGRIFAPIDPTRADSVTLERTSDGYVMGDLLRGKLVFDVAGRLVRVTDVRGNAMDISRDAQGLPTAFAIHEPSEIVLRVNCDEKTKRLKSIDGEGRAQLFFEYDAAGFLSKVTSPGRPAETYHYDQGRLCAVADAAGRRVQYRYDNFGRLVEIGRNGRKETRGYKDLSADGRDWMVTTTDPIGRTSEYRLLVSVRQEFLHEPDGTTIERYFDEDWQLQREKSTRDGEVTYRRDAKGRVTGVLGPGRRILLIQRDPVLGLPLLTTDERLQSTQYQFGLSGKLTGIRSGGGELTVRYDRYGRVADMEHSVWGNLSPRQGGPATSPTMREGAAEEPPAPDWGKFLQPPAFARLPVSPHRMHLIIDLDGTRPIADDPLKRTVTLRLSDARQWVCQYDLFGNMQEIREGDRSVASFKFDAADRLVEARYGPAATEAFEYDAADRVLRHAATDGSRTQCAYDSRGFLISMQKQGGEEKVFDYNDDGLLVSAFDAFWHDLFQYDAAGCLTKVGRLVSKGSPPLVTVSHSYDNDGRLVLTSFDGGPQCQHSYNNDGSLETLKIGDAVVTIQNDAAGRTSLLHLPGGIKAEYAFRSDGALTRLSVQSDAGTPLVTQLCIYQNDRLARVLYQHGGNRGEYRPGEQSPATSPASRGTGIDPFREFDALDRRRLLNTGTEILELAYGRGGLVIATSGDKTTYVVRSSDGWPRACWMDGRKRFVLPTAIPEQWLALDEKGELRTVHFRDGNNPWLSPTALFPTVAK